VFLTYNINFNFPSSFTGRRGYSQNLDSFKILMQRCDEGESFVGGKKKSPAITEDL